MTNPLDDNKTLSLVDSSECPDKQAHLHADENAEVVFDRNDPQGNVTISVVPDKLKAFLKVTSLSNEEKYSPDDLLNIITSSGITTPVNRESIVNGLSCLKKEGDTTEFILLGKGPINGTDGECEILYNQDSPYVQKDQMLLRIVNYSTGTDGQNIYGDIIKAIPGKIPNITAGDNVRKDETNLFYSNIFGNVTFENNIISVYKALEIEVSSDHMEAKLIYAGVEKLSTSIILDEISAHNITTGIDEDAIANIIEKFNSTGNPIQNHVIARGIPCKKGRDGQIKYLFHKGRGLNPHEYIEDGVITQGTPTIKSVEKNTKIAFILPPEEPVPGKDIYGKVIPIQQTVRKVKLRAGKNVKASDDGLHFYAQITGLPVIEGDAVSISDTLRIPRLDYTVGNIDFDGFVEIHGDVADGFKVKTTKTLLIKGVVGSCDLEAGIDIQIDGGCNGQGKSHIICGGTLKAKYLDEVYVKARGDIEVKNEIVDSHILTLGRIFVKKGSLYGGIITAKKGVECLDIGNDMSIKTTIIPGDDFELNEAVRKIDDDINQKNKEMTVISKKIAPLVKNKELLKNLPEESKSKLKETINSLTKLREERDMLNQSKIELLAREVKDAIPEIIVYHYIYSGVILKIGKTRRQISSLLEGPIRLYEENDRISVEPYSNKSR